MNSQLRTLEAQWHLDVAYTPEDLATLGTLRFTPETLQRYKDTHVLVPGAPLCFNDICARTPRIMQDMRMYEDDVFATDTVMQSRWYLVGKEPMRKSFSKTYDEQVALLTKNEEVPRACELAYVMALHWLAHRKRLLKNGYSVTNDFSQDDDRICFGYFTGRVEPWELHDDLDRNDSIGLVSSVRPERLECPA